MSDANSALHPGNSMASMPPIGCLQLSGALATWGIFLGLGENSRSDGLWLLSGTPFGTMPDAGNGLTAFAKATAVRRSISGGGKAVPYRNRRLRAMDVY
jgi:hypothetical protein